MKRQLSESFADFKARRLAENNRISNYLKGTLIHASRRTYEDPDGKTQVRSVTYRRPKNV